MTDQCASCLDIIASPKQLECIIYLVIPCAARDHIPVEAMFQATPSTTLQPIIKRSFIRTNMEDLHQRVAGIDLEVSGLQKAVELLCTRQNAITTILDQVKPLKRNPLCKKKFEWMTSDILGLIRHRE